MSNPHFEFLDNVIESGKEYFMLWPPANDHNPRAEIGHNSRRATRSELQGLVVTGSVIIIASLVLLTVVGAKLHLFELTKAFGPLYPVPANDGLLSASRPLASAAMTAMQHIAHASL